MSTEKDKGVIKKKNNGNVRCNESGIGLYSSAVQHAILNGLKDFPDKDYNNLSDEEKKEWEKIYNVVAEQFTQATSPLAFYNIKGNQIKFSILHTIVIMVLEEMYNQQSIDNIYNWSKGKNGTNYDEMGYVYTNPTQLAQYIWGYVNQKNVTQVADILDDLFKEKFYLTRVEKQPEKGRKKGGTRDVYRVKELNLIITRDMTVTTDKTGRHKRVYTRVQLHPIFFEKIGKNNIRHRNNLYQRLRDYNNSLRSVDSKQKFKLPPDTDIYTSHFLSKFTRMKVFSLTLDEDTLARETNIKEFEQRRITRGRTKIKNALNALHNAGMITEWSETTGRNGQRQYRIELNRVFFGYQEMPEDDKSK